MTLHRHWAGLSTSAAGALLAVAGLCASAPVDAQTLRGAMDSGNSGFSTTVRRGDPSGTGDADGVGEDGADAAAPRPRYSNARPVVIDGNPNWAAEPPVLRDGIVDTAEDQPVPDGAEAIGLDTRSREDIEAFERPSAGHDADAFAVEVEPILDRRPARLARFEPFDPVGLRMGSFTVFPEAEMVVGTDSNVFRSSSNARRDVALEFKPTVRAVSNWRTHALEFRATGLSTFHNEFSTEDDRSYTLETRGRLDITRRTNIEALASFDHALEQRGSINATSAAGERTPIDTSRAALTFNHRFNRLSLQLRGAVTDTDYDAISGAGGVRISNESRDNQLREAAVRASWMFKPTLAVFAEVVGNARTYNGIEADGIRRDSTGDRVRAGVSFGNTSKILRGEVAVGRAEQRFDDKRLGSIDGIVLDANLAWRVSGLTSLLFTARSDIAESTLAGSGGALSQTVGVEARHAFRRNLIGTAGVSLSRQEYEGVDITEQALTGLLGLEYHLNREVTMFGRYTHVAFDSTDVARDYNSDAFKVGVRVRR
ncbi:MAG: outer membrane beta-barrel protein [Hyphomicrobiaceae bacterium]